MEDCMKDRRYDLRVNRESPVSLSWTDLTGQTLQSTGHLADISRSGASIKVPRPVKVGSTLSLGYQDQQLPGKVTHCKSEVSGYLLGIEFEDGHRWSPRR
jgi:hypothetical protein